MVRGVPVEPPDGDREIAFGHASPVVGVDAVPQEVVQPLFRVREVGHGISFQFGLPRGGGEIVRAEKVRPVRGTFGTPMREVANG